MPRPRRDFQQLGPPKTPPVPPSAGPSAELRALLRHVLDAGGVHLDDVAEALDSLSPAALARVTGAVDPTTRQRLQKELIEVEVNLPQGHCGFLWDVLGEPTPTWAEV